MHIVFERGMRQWKDLVAEVRLFAGSFAPTNWAFCDGSVLQIRVNTALFALLGNRYGGDGRETFALPDLRGRVALGAGQGNGLSYSLGQAAGTDQVPTQTVRRAPVAARARR